jgi:hypothetical protein
MRYSAHPHGDEELTSLHFLLADKINDDPLLIGVGIPSFLRIDDENFLDRLAFAPRRFPACFFA